MGMKTAQEMKEFQLEQIKKKLIWETERFVKRIQDRIEIDPFCSTIIFRDTMSEICEKQLKYLGYRVEHIVVGDARYGDDEIHEIHISW